MNITYISRRHHSVYRPNRSRKHPVVETRTGYRQVDPVHRIKKKRRRRKTKSLAACNTQHHDSNSYDTGAHKTAYVICFAEQESIHGGNRSKPVLGNPNLRNENTSPSYVSKQLPNMLPCLGQAFW